MKRLLLVVLTSGWLAACSTVPEPVTHSDVDDRAVAAQQSQLEQREQWRLKGQMALFDLRQDNRHGVYVDWFSSASTLSMRFSHPLRGTLARLHQQDGLAVLTDEDGKEYRAESAEQLLFEYFQMDLPITVINSIVMGKQLPGMIDTHYQLRQHQQQQLALLSDFVMIAADQLWRAQLRDYTPVDGTFMPHSIDLTTDAWRLKLKVSEWKF